MTEEPSGIRARTVDAEAVLFECDDGIRDRLVVRQFGEAVGCISCGHLQSSSFRA